MRSRHENGVVCMEPVSSKKVVSCGVSTDTRFISHPALVASAHREHLTMRLNLNVLGSIVMRSSLPRFKFVLKRVRRMSGLLTCVS